MQKLIALTIVLAFFIGTTGIAFAYPGRTDRYGGHTCRTNCYKWGLRYGQYHYHGRR